MRKLKAKGLALNTVWGLIIAMASVLLFLSLVTGTLRNAVNYVYCKTFVRIINFFAGSEMASIPEMCKPYITTHARVEEIKESDNRIVSRKLLSYIIACWKEAEIKGLYSSHPCYEIKLPGTVDNVTEANISKILIEEDRCMSIENSDYGCGFYNQIIWSVDGKVVWWSPSEISSIVNTHTEPSPIPLDESMVPVAKDITIKDDLIAFLTTELPKTVCDSMVTCTEWFYDGVNDEVVFSIDSNEYRFNVTKVYESLNTSATEKFVDVFNENTVPTSIPLEPEIVASSIWVEDKLKLVKAVSGTIPLEVCSYYPECINVEYNETTNTLKFNFTSRIYSCDVDRIISGLEKLGVIRSPINTQKIVLIEYDGAKDAVELIAGMGAF